MNNNFDPNQQVQPEAPQQPVYEQAPAQAEINPTPILVMAIIGLCLGCIPGIILCAIALNKVKAYVAAGYELAGVAKVGKILATIGLILSIISTVFIAIYVIVFVIAMIAAGASGGSYYYY